MVKFQIRVLLFVLVTITIACSETAQNENLQEPIFEISDSTDISYQLAQELLSNLKKNHTDTIIFYKRTCVDCCDFYSVFWSSNGQRHLRKYYFENMRTESKNIDLTTDKIFDFLGDHFVELKNTSIKKNFHKRKDGTTLITLIDHDCYVDMSIYTSNDSIKPEPMYDHDFEKYAQFDIPADDNKQKADLNDNYQENIESKWNTLLTIIESELLVKSKPSKYELRH